MNDLSRISRLIDHVSTPWAAALLKAMRRNIMDGRELTPMHRSALDRIERQFLCRQTIGDDEAFSAAVGASGKIKTRRRRR